MRRALFTSSSGAGHLLPLLPVASAARQAGWDVVIAAPPESQHLVEPSGIRFVGLDNIVPGDDPRRGAVFANFASLAEEERSSTVLREIFGYLNTLGTVDATKELVSQFAPDVIVSSYMEGSGMLGAEIADVPFALITPSLFSSRMDAAFATGMQRIRDREELPADIPERLSSAPIISYWPQTLEAESLDRQVLRIKDTRFAPPTSSRDADHVFITLGSEAASFPGFSNHIQGLIDGVALAGMTATVAVGKHGDPSALDAPAGFEVSHWVDLGDALSKCSLVIHQCGSGISVASLATATPMIAMPLFADQPFNASRLQANDAALVVSPGPNLATDVANAISSLREHVPPGLQKLADEMTQHSDPSAAIDLIAELAAR